jgi:hypothetical protein
MYSLDYLFQILSQMYSLDYLFQILSQMYSLDYQLHTFYHICTAYIIDSTDVITNAQLGSSTPQMLS